MKFYLDTSVFGGIFDKEFEYDTAEFLKYVREIRAEVIYSNIVVKELEQSPEHVKNVIQLLEVEKKINTRRININDAAENLAKTYIEEGALTEKCEEDARHIALASIYDEIDILISWNFKHMVNFMRIKQYNSINLRLGYRNIDIRTPKEAIL